MTTASSEPPEVRAIRRILLALDSGQDLAALEAAAALAERLRARLVGMFVEDTELLRLAGLPFAREIAFGSAASRPLELAQLERELRSQAGRLRRLLEEHAGQRRLEWSFSVVRGSLPQTLQLEQADLYVFGQARALAERGLSATGPVLTFYDGSLSTQRALEAALALAGDEDGLLVLLPAKAEKSSDTLRAEAEALVQAAGHRAEYLIVSPTSSDKLLQTARTRRARLLVLGEWSEVGEPQTLNRLLQAASCPVVLVR
jgi:nucleotide-binding universal stress UspA family protein